jgi:hypothetical protein
MITGTDKFRIVFGSTVYEPSGWCNLIPDIENLNIVRRSKKTSKENIRGSWNYYNATAKVKDLTAEEITFFRSISGQEVRLYPNIDVPGISYYCSVTKAEIKYEGGKPWKPYVDLRFDGVYDVDILTTLTAKSITIKAPAGPVTWVNGYQFTVSWTFNNFPNTENVRIDLYRNDVYISTIASSIGGNPGHYHYTVPANLPTGTGYAIRVSQISDLYVYAETPEIQIDSEYWTDEDGAFVTDENGDPIPMN